jgi:tRNA G10  N-methylase Trm11
MCIHHFYSGKCTQEEYCINSHEFQKKDLFLEKEKKRHSDARKIKFIADAIVTDLPYGKSSAADEKLNKSS